MPDNKQLLSTLHPIREIAIGAEDIPDLPFFDGVDVDALTEGDDAPMFLSIPVVAETENRGAELGAVSRYYPLDEVRSIVRQMEAKRPGGILGHIKDSERSTRVDVPTLIWVGGKLDETLDPPVAFGKAYVLPSAADVRLWLKTAKAAGQKVAVSIYGLGREVWDPARQAYRVEDFDLETIDIAPPDRAGLALGGEFKITSEMVQAAADTVTEGIAEARQQIAEAVTLRLEDDAVSSNLVDLLNAILDRLSFMHMTIMDRLPAPAPDAPVETPKFPVAETTDPVQPDTAGSENPQQEVTNRMAIENVTQWLQENADDAAKLTEHFKAVFGVEALQAKIASVESAAQEALAKFQSDLAAKLAEATQPLEAKLQTTEATVNEMVALVGAADAQAAKTAIQEMAAARAEAVKTQREAELNAAIDAALADEQKPLKSLVSLALGAEFATGPVDADKIKTRVAELLDRDDALKSALRRNLPAMVLGAETEQAQATSPYLEIEEREV